MKILMVILCILIMSTSAYADEFFTNSEIKDLRIIELNSDEGKVVIKDPDGYEAEVSIGDTVGADGGIVIKIDKSSITIQVGNTNTKIPAKHAVGKSAG